jgi:hypothetical protein
MLSSRAGAPISTTDHVSRPSNPGAGRRGRLRVERLDRELTTWDFSGRQGFVEWAKVTFVASTRSIAEELRLASSTTFRTATAASTHARWATARCQVGSVRRGAARHLSSENRGQAMGDLIRFVLSNFTLSFLVAGLIASGVALMRAPKPLTAPSWSRHCSPISCCSRSASAFSTIS